MRRTKSQIETPVQEIDNDPVPTDPVEFRLELVRRMNTFAGAWRHCDRRLCKRARACRSGPPFACMRDLPKATPQQSARTAAGMKRALDRRLADIAAERATAEAAGKPGVGGR